MVSYLIICRNLAVAGTVSPIYLGWFVEAPFEGLISDR